MNKTILHRKKEILIFLSKLLDLSAICGPYGLAAHGTLRMCQGLAGDSAGRLQLELSLPHICITTSATTVGNICNTLYLIATVRLQKSCSPAALWLSSYLRPVRRCHYCHQDFYHACPQHKMHYKQCCSCLLLLCFTAYTGLIWSELGRSIHGLFCLGSALG